MSERERPAGVAARLETLYRRYVGEPESTIWVHLGFGLFFAGVALGVTGVAVFLYSATLPVEDALTWQLREVAVVLAAVGLVGFLVSVVVLLPVDRRALGVAAAGAVVCLGAVGLFVVAYPYDWNVPGQDYSAVGVTAYAVGTVLLAAADGAALVANYLHRAITADATADGPAGARSNGDDAAVDEERIRADIEEAASGADLTVGGVEPTETRRLDLDTSDADDVDVSGAGGTETRATGTDVDAAVEGLSQVRATEQVETSSEGTDEQAAALRELRADGPPGSDGPSDGGVVDRVRERLGL